MSEHQTLLQPEGRVLATLEADGSRRWLYPKLVTGVWWYRRQVFAYLLIVFFLALPWLRMPGSGEPVVLLDIYNRKFHLLGATFLPTDTLLLAILVVACFLTVFWMTAVMGRAFCGWFCPHSVYLEFVYRPVERLFMGRAGRGGKPAKGVPTWRKVAMYLVFLLISVHLGNTFVAYFVGTDALHAWVWTATPWEHPMPFLVVALATGWIMWDMAVWREQMCMVGCPYGRFQSVMLDRHSLIVSYDPHRGEPRGKRGKVKPGEPGGDVALPVLGDCVDCHLCVAVCPTGIDIRDGLQMECINCTACIDACDSVMDKVGKPRGLIRYGSQAGIDGERFSLLRPRVILYPIALVALTAFFVTVLANKPSTELTVLRGVGRPFAVLNADTPTTVIENRLRVKLVNRTDEARTYTVAVLPEAGGEAFTLESADGTDWTLAPGEMATHPVRLLIDPAAYERGRINAVVRVTDDRGVPVSEAVLLRGPAAGHGTPGSAPAVAPQSREAPESAQGVSTGQEGGGGG